MSWMFVWVCIDSWGMRGDAINTDLVRHGERRVQPVVLDDGTAPLWRAHGAHVSHAESVAWMMSTQILHTSHTHWWVHKISATHPHLSRTQTHTCLCWMHELAFCLFLFVFGGLINKYWSTKVSIRPLRAINMLHKRSMNSLTEPWGDRVCRRIDTKTSDSIDPRQRSRTQPIEVPRQVTWSNFSAV